MKRLMGNPVSLTQRMILSSDIVASREEKKKNVQQLNGEKFIAITFKMNTNAHHHSVSLCKTCHGRQSAAGYCREGFKDPVVQVYSLVFLEMPMGSQFGQPDVEDIVTLCLEGEDKSTHPQTNGYI